MCSITPEHWGVSVRADGGNIVVTPASKIPAEVKSAIREHKPGILARLRPLGDEAPPLDRPPATEQELRRLMDHLADPEAFTRWLEWAMSYIDPAEEQQ